MRNLLMFVRAIVAGVVKYRTLIPRGFVVIFTVLSAIIIGFQQGPKEGFIAFAKSVLAAELVIQQNTQLAIAADPSYSLFAFLQIINSVFILYILIRFIAKTVLIGMTGSQAPVMAYVAAIGIIGLIEMAVVGWTEATFFIPIWDGLIFMFINITPVLNNINWLSFAMPAPPDISTVLNESVTIPQNTSQMLNATDM